jgi:hypothetical protein
MQQEFGLLDVGHVGRGCGHGMHESRIGIHPNMRLHPEVMEWSPLPDPALEYQSGGVAMAT